MTQNLTSDRPNQTAYPYHLFCSRIFGRPWPCSPVFYPRDPSTCSPIFDHHTCDLTSFHLHGSQTCGRMGRSGGRREDRFEDHCETRCVGHFAGRCVGRFVDQILAWSLTKKSEWVCPWSKQLRAQMAPVLSMSSLPWDLIQHAVLLWT